MSSTQMGKVARYWQYRDKRSVSLTQATDRVVKKAVARMKRPKKDRANRIDVFIGESGTGKSTVLRKLADRLTAATGNPWQSKLVHVATQGFEDNTGLPIIKKVERGGRKQQIAGFAPADHVPGAVWQDHYTLGILDELTTAPPLIQNQIREWIDGQINGQPIDPKCLLIGTGNPPDAKFVTVNALDDALEKRLKIYVIVPTQDELLSVWSQIMPDTVYKFLLMNQMFIDALSPREWEGVSKDVQDLIDGGGTLEEASEEATDALIEHPDVEIKFREWMKWGDNPDRYPIRGQQILDAENGQVVTYVKRVEGWLKHNQRGLAGASALDLVRTLNMTPKEDLEKLGMDRLADNIVQFVVPYTENEANDMANAILKIVLSSELVDKVCALLGQKPTSLASLSESVKRFHIMKSKLDASPVS